MRRSSKIALALAVLLLGGAAFLLLRRTGPPPRPETRIRQALREAEDAARRRDVGGIMKVVSNDYQDGVYNKDRLRLVLMQGIQRTRGTPYDVQVTTQEIIFEENRPDQALVLTTIVVMDPRSNEALWGGQEMTLVMRRESRRRWLLFPEETWRVVSVVGMPALPGVGDEGAMFGL